MFQGDGTNVGLQPLFHEEIALAQQVIRRGEEEYQSLSLGEKGRYVTLLGRIKENTENLRHLHNVMDPEWKDLLGDGGQFICGLSGDLKYLLTMNGHQGASAKYPCPCCVRSRELLAWRSWIPVELAYIKQQQPKTFMHGQEQMRAYPDNAACPHDVEGQTCLCMSKGAEYVQQQISQKYPNEAAVHAITSQTAPFHSHANKLCKEHSYSIVAPALMPDIPLELRMPGPWHCTHNIRVMMWLMCKDIACQSGVLSALQAVMASIGLGNITVTADKKPRRVANIEQAITDENAAAALVIDKQEGDSRTSKAGMDGTELVKVFENFSKILTAMKAGAKDAGELLKLDRWGPPFTLALAAFDEGCKVLLADLWPTDRSAELAHFRTFFDRIMDIPDSAGLPYPVREYLAILPIHWLCEPSHVERTAHSIHGQFGVAMGTGTDAATEVTMLRLPMLFLLMLPPPMLRLPLLLLLMLPPPMTSSHICNLADPE